MIKNHIIDGFNLLVLVLGAVLVAPMFLIGWCLGVGK